MHTEPNQPNQNYWSKQSTPGSVVPLAMFSFWPPDVLARSDCVMLKRLLGGGLRTGCVIFGIVEFIKADNAWVQNAVVMQCFIAMISVN